MSNPPEVFSS